MKKGLLLLNNNVEDVEALATRALLIRAGYDIKTFTLENNKNIITAYNLKIEVDFLVDEVLNEINAYDFLVLPGGKHVFKWNNDQKLNEIIIDFHDNNKMIAAICAAPLFLESNNLLVNEDFTCFYGLENKINGRFINDKKVVLSNNIITGRSAGVIYDFVYEIVGYFEEKASIDALKLDIIY